FSLEPEGESFSLEPEGEAFALEPEIDALPVFEPAGGNAPSLDAEATRMLPNDGPPKDDELDELFVELLDD
ncbi:MAG: hypothetical protein MJE66_08870, partial [Proteobacteria bacterium]|nr:hypothetical protein [Pseudomonadota bacterium]